MLANFRLRIRAVSRNMLYRHVFDKISTEFRGFFRVFVNFADLPEFRGSGTARNIRSPVNSNFRRVRKRNRMEKFRHFS